MSEKMRIIGLAGTNGSGKDTVGHMLVERHGFLFAGASEMLAEELNKRAWPLDRKHKAILSSEWRREHGMGVVVDKALAKFNDAPGEHNGLIVGSLRHPGEVDRVHELGGMVVWVDANPHIRYDRIRSANRGREAEDDKTFDQFMAEERAEMSQSGDAATLDMGAVKARADIFLENNGNDIEAFKNYAEKQLGFQSDILT